MKNNNKGKRNNNSKFISGKINIPSHPPSFDMQPWFQITLRLLNPPAAITINVIRSALASQLQQAEVSDFDMRIFECRFWGSLVDGNGALQPLTVRVFDPIYGAPVAGSLAPVSNTTAVLQDFPDRVNRARLGFRYTPAQQQVVIPCSSTNGTASMYSTAGMGTNSVAYLNVLWRPRSTLAPTIVDDPPMYEPSAPTPSCFKMF